MVSGTFDGLIPFGFGPIIPIFPDITGAIVYENNITIASEGNGPIARVAYFWSKIFNPYLLRWSPWPLCVTHFWPSEATIFFSLKLSESQSDFVQWGSFLFEVPGLLFIQEWLYVIPKHLAKGNMFLGGGGTVPTSISQKRLPKRSRFFLFKKGVVNLSCKTVPLSAVLEGNNPIQPESNITVLREMLVAKWVIYLRLWFEPSYPLSSTHILQRFCRVVATFPCKNIPI